LQRKPNTDGWGNKLVTIFARHLDNYILKPYLSLIYLTRDSGSGQIRFAETILSFAGTCKNCAIPSSPPGQIPAKEPGHVAGWLRRVTFTPSTAGPLAFSIKPLHIEMSLHSQSLKSYNNLFHSHIDNTLLQNRPLTQANDVQMTCKVPPNYFMH